jgi:capsular polysaccharide export protein
LRARIVAQRITKYNVGAGSWSRPAGARRVILVPGQVESDASIAYGASRIRSNIGLLAAVRAAEPDAYVVYKPHPDVVARLRQPGQHEGDASRLCDEVVADTPIDVLLERVDEVHVLTSLAGFEALLRGCRVVVYGWPFYAGWGLTEDRDPPPRRGRPRSLDELVAATLILYPTYISHTTGRFTSPERVLDELGAWRERGVTRLPFWRRVWRGLNRHALQVGTWLRWR